MCINLSLIVASSRWYEYYAGNGILLCVFKYVPLKLDPRIAEAVSTNRSFGIFFDAGLDFDQYII